MLWGDNNVEIRPGGVIVHAVPLGYPAEVTVAYSATTGYRVKMLSMHSLAPDDPDSGQLWSDNVVSVDGRTDLPVGTPGFVYPTDGRTRWAFLAAPAFGGTGSPNTGSRTSTTNSQPDVTLFVTSLPGADPASSDTFLIQLQKVGPSGGDTFVTQYYPAGTGSSSTYVYQLNHNSSNQLVSETYTVQLRNSTTHTTTRTETNETYTTQIPSNSAQYLYTIQMGTLLDTFVTQTVVPASETYVVQIGTTEYERVRTASSETYTVQIGAASANVTTISASGGAIVTAMAGTWDASAATLVGFGSGVFSEATIAAAGSTQSDAAALTATMNKVTGGDGTKGVILVNKVGPQFVWNNSASNLKVYPSSGGNINTFAADAAQTVIANMTQLYWRTASGKFVGFSLATVT